MSFTNQYLVVDIAGPVEWPGTAGKSYIYVGICLFSGYCVARVETSRSEEVAAEFIIDWASTFGAPVYWVSDQEASFLSGMNRCLRKRLGIIDEFAATYSPKTTGAAERMIGEIKALIRCSRKGTSLKDAVRAAVWVHNVTPDEKTISPFKLMFLREPRQLDDAVESPVSSPHNAPVEELMENLKEMTAYWCAKINERRNKASDKSEREDIEEFEPGTVVIKMARVGLKGKISPLGKFEVLGKEGSRYWCRSLKTDAKCFIPAHQLTRLNVDNEVRVGLPKTEIEEILYEYPLLEALSVDDSIIVEVRKSPTHYEYRVAKIVALLQDDEVEVKFFKVKTRPPPARYLDLEAKTVKMGKERIFLNGFALSADGRLPQEVVELMCQHGIVF